LLFKIRIICMLKKCWNINIWQSENKSFQNFVKIENKFFAVHY
jgi:hypothetical protein